MSANPGDRSATLRPSEGAAPAGRGEWRFPAVVGSIPHTRHAVRDFAQGCGADQDVLDAIALCVTEATTNAVLHAFLGREPGTVTVQACAEPETLVVRVLDDGTGMRPRTDSPGLGLGIPTIGRVARTLDIREGPRGVGAEVCMTFAAPGVRGDQPAVAPGRRYEVLAEVTRIASGDGWPREGVDRLVDAVVPAVADACAIEVVDESGVPRRLAGRIDAADGGESSRWLARLKPRYDADGSAAKASLQQRRAMVVELTPEHIARVTTNDEDAARMAATGLRWWFVLPLAEGDRLLGLLHVGAREPFSDDALGFVREIGGRVAGALANSRLAADLHRARARFEVILETIAEGVTVHDAEGRTLYANDAAARLLDVASGRDLVAARPGAVAARWTFTHEDGTELDLDDTPGRRLARGLPAEPMVMVMTDRETGEVRRLRLEARKLGEEDLAVTITTPVPPPADA